MSPRVTAVHPQQAIEGGRIIIEGFDFPIDAPSLPDVRIGHLPARLVYASPTRLVALVPAGLTGGRSSVSVAGTHHDLAFVDVAEPIATGLHQVDNPVFDAGGNMYVTFSGSRGQQVPVSIFRVRTNGARDSFSSAIVNPTSMALDRDGRLYVSSRFEGTVYRVRDDGSAEAFVRELGVACGLAFDPDDNLYVGDRSGTIFRVDRAGHATVLASLPSSIAAFHLAMGPDRALYVSGPTLASHDPIYRVNLDGDVTIRARGFGRPQGLAFDVSGTLHVVEALTSANGLYRLTDGGESQLVLAGSGLIGVAFDSSGGVVVCSNDTAFRLAASASRRVQ